MSNSPPRPLFSAPKLSPTRGPSPRRRPLHQRSDSESNSHAPTIRIVADSGSNVYSKSPFPSHPSQILQPRYAPFEDRGRHVSDENTPSNNPPSKPTKLEALVPRPLQPRKSNRASTSTTTSEADTSFTSNGSTFSPSPSRFSSRTSPPSSLLEEDHDRTETRLAPVHEETVPRFSSSSALRPTIRPVAPSGSNDRLPLGTKQSETSLASSASADALTAGKTKDRPGSTESGNYFVFPHSSSSSLQADRRKSSRGIKTYSTESLAFSDASYSSNAERPRSASSPASPSHASVRAAKQSGAKVQYPVVRPPSASGSWAEVSRPSSKNTSRMNEGPYRPPPWSSRLSTIASESERTSQSISSSGNHTRRRRTIGSLTSDGETGLASQSEERSSEFEYGSGVLTGSESGASISLPPALFTGPGTLQNTHGHDIVGRDSDERDDTLGELQPPPLRQQRSGFLSRFSSRSRPSSADSAQSERSQISFLGDLSWARRYYSGGEQVNLGARSGIELSHTDSNSSARLNTATSGTTSSPISDTFPTSVWRPRNRPHQNPDRAPQRPMRLRDSMAITEVSEVDSVPGGQRSRATLSVNEMMFSPHLRRDKRARHRYSAWAAPSLEEPFSKNLFGPTNRQVLLFCIGFLFPLAWMLAAILPLPRRPETYENPEGMASVAQVSEYDGRGYPQSVMPSDISVDEKRWLKANWWRTVNRILSILGLLIIAAVVALAVLGTRMRKQAQGAENTPLLQPLG